MATIKTNRFVEEKNSLTYKKGLNNDKLFLKMEGCTTDEDLQEMATQYCGNEKPEIVISEFFLWGVDRYNEEMAEFM